MIESSWGRRWSLAGSTLVTALFCVAFAFAESSFFVRLSTIGISLSSTVRSFLSIVVIFQALILIMVYLSIRQFTVETGDVGCLIRLDA